MATEAIVSLLGERLLDLAVREAVFLRGVNEEVRGLVDELERMKSALKVAEGRQEQQDDLSRKLMNQIRECAEDAEDVIETHILKVVQTNKFTGFMTKPFHLHTIGEQVRAIQARLERISKTLPAYRDVCGKGETSSSNSNSRQRPIRRTNSLATEEFVVSSEGITSQVLGQLMKEEEDGRLRVVSIVGMGGIGKTTLANKLYSHVDVTSHFDSCAWAFISQECKAREVFQEILLKVLSPGKYRELMDTMKEDESMRKLMNKLKEDELMRKLTDKLKEDELMRTLRDVLSEKRYLIVLDDIWRRDQWNILKDAFPAGKKGSKILFTTRKKDVALRADPLSSPVELPFLTEDQSWELFKRKAFPGDGAESSHACTDEFEKLGKEMVKRCGGLPLAIVVLGGLLATEKSLAQWERVQRRFNAHLNEDDAVPVDKILELSYHDLPLHLKPCFLYLAHYPEDWEISKKELIRLWIAEGFISLPLGSGELLMEDEAEQCLEELINRCLVQVGKKDHTGTGVKTCRMHDLLRDLCVEKAKEENFLGIIQPPSSVNNGPRFRVNLAESKERRIAIHPSKRQVVLEGKHPKLRSLLLFQDDYY